MKQSGETWIDARGQKVPAKYINNHQKLDEKTAHALIREAKILSDKIDKFKDKAFKKVMDSYNCKIAEHGINGREFKGNHTVYSFDQELKISLQISEGVIFDDALIGEAQDKFQQYVVNKLRDDQADLGKLILSAFEKSGGQFDPKKVLALHKFRSVIKDKLFQEALDLLDQSTMQSGSRQYMQFFEKDKKGEYQRILLNFAAL